MKQKKPLGKPEANNILTKNKCRQEIDGNAKISLKAGK